MALSMPLMLEMSVSPCSRMRATRSALPSAPPPSRIASCSSNARYWRSMSAATMFRSACVCAVVRRGAAATRLPVYSVTRNAAVISRQTPLVHAALDVAHAVDEEPTDDSRGERQGRRSADHQLEPRGHPGEGAGASGGPPPAPSLPPCRTPTGTARASSRTAGRRRRAFGGPRRAPSPPPCRPPSGAAGASGDSGSAPSPPLCLPPTEAARTAGESWAPVSHPLYRVVASVRPDHR